MKDSLLRWNSYKHDVVTVLINRHSLGLVSSERGLSPETKGSKLRPGHSQLRLVSGDCQPSLEISNSECWSTGDLK